MKKRPRIRAALRGGIPLINKKKDMEICKPIEFGVITSNYGNRISPINQKPEFHRGIDIAVINNPINVPVRVTKKGIVKWIDKTRVYNPDNNTGSFGMVVYVFMSDGWYAIYPHMEAILDSVKIGMVVEAGQQIGIMGSTGLSLGRHVHYEERDSMAATGKSRCPQDIIDLYLNDKI